MNLLTKCMGDRGHNGVSPVLGPEELQSVLFVFDLHLEGWANYTSQFVAFYFLGPC